MEQHAYDRGVIDGQNNVWTPPPPAWPDSVADAYEEGRKAGMNPHDRFHHEQTAARLSELPS